MDTIEPNLPKGCIVYDYPKWQAALARTRHGVAERFEVTLTVLANAFDEESPVERSDNDGFNPMPFDYRRESAHIQSTKILQAIDTMPRCSGIALGIDRLMMLLLRQQSIHGLL